MSKYFTLTCVRAWLLKLFLVISKWHCKALPKVDISSDKKKHKKQDSGSIGTSNYSTPPFCICTNWVHQQNSKLQACFALYSHKNCAPIATQINLITDHDSPQSQISVEHLKGCCRLTTDYASGIYFINNTLIKPILTKRVQLVTAKVEHISCLPQIVNVEALKNQNAP